MPMVLYKWTRHPGRYGESWAAENQGTTEVRGRRMGDNRLSYASGRPESPRGNAPLGDENPTATRVGCNTWKTCRAETERREKMAQHSEPMPGGVSDPMERS